MSLTENAAIRQAETVAPAARAGEPARPALKVVREVVVDRTRDALLTDFGKKTMEDR